MAIRAPVQQLGWSDGHYYSGQGEKEEKSWETSSDISTAATTPLQSPRGSPRIQSRNPLLPLGGQEYAGATKIMPALSRRSLRASLTSVRRQWQTSKDAGPEGLVDKAAVPQVSPKLVCRLTLKKTDFVTGVPTLMDKAAVAQVSPKLVYRPTLKKTDFVTGVPTLMDKAVASQVSPKLVCRPTLKKTDFVAGVPTLMEKPKTQPLASLIPEELPIPQSKFDPFDPSVKSVLLAKLGLSRTATIEASPDNSGAFNDGVWLVSADSALDTSAFVLKLVPHSRTHLGRGTDVEKFSKLEREHPQVTTDPTITFPCKTFEIVSPMGSKVHDLIVMRSAAGFQITQHLYFKFQGNQTAQLLIMFKSFGEFMHRFHRSYKGMQHGDCQPSNVFYDDMSGNFTLIDAADLGYGPFIADGGENDVEHFIAGLKTLSCWYGSQLISDCEKQFRIGYMPDMRCS